jgi:hypothetical protein
MCCLYLLHGCVKHFCVLFLQIASYSTCAAAEVLEELNGSLPLMRCISSSSMVRASCGTMRVNTMTQPKP